MENKQVKQLLIDCPVCGTRHYIHTSSNGYNSWFHLGAIKANMTPVKPEEAGTSLNPDCEQGSL